MSERRCKRCGEPITDKNRSSEHIIHNAIGGTLENDGIYCQKCNSDYGTKEDYKFTGMFAPLIDIYKIRRTRKTRGTTYTGILFDSSGNLYEAKYKNGKITSVFNKDGEYIKDGGKNLSFAGFNFKIDEDTFKKGLAKIAFNYAVHCGIAPKDMKALFNVDTHQLQNQLCVIPFIPLTESDKMLETHKDERLYHALRLFSINHYLFAYVELFSTFQCYVLVSEDYSGQKIEESYCAFIEKRYVDDKDIEKFTPSSIDDAVFKMQQYGIKHDDIIEGLKRVESGTSDESIIFDKIGHIIFDSYRKNIYTADYNDVVDIKYQATGIKDTETKYVKDELEFYLAKNEKIDISKYKKILPDGSNYPLSIMELCRNDPQAATEYRRQKIKMLNQHKPLT